MNLSVRIVLNRWERSRDEFLDKVNSGDNSMFQVAGTQRLV